MDMKHDFKPDPEVGAVDAPRACVPVELILIGGIFVAVWLALGVHLLVNGARW